MTKNGTGNARRTDLMVNVHIHQFRQPAEVVDAEAMKFFHAQWSIYRKLVDANVLHHRQVARIIHDALDEKVRQRAVGRMP